MMLKFPVLLTIADFFSSFARLFSLFLIVVATLFPVISFFRRNKKRKITDFSTSDSQKNAEPMEKIVQFPQVISLTFIASIPCGEESEEHERWIWLKTERNENITIYQVNITDTQTFSCSIERQREEIGENIAVKFGSQCEHRASTIRPLSAITINYVADSSNWLISAKKNILIYTEHASFNCSCLHSHFAHRETSIGVNTKS